MAYRKRTGFRSFAKRQWANRKNYATAGSKILGMNAGMVAGVAVGLTEYDKMIPLDVKIALAVLPGKVIPYQIKMFCAGLLVGDIIQARTGFTLGGGSSGAASNNTASPGGW